MIIRINNLRANGILAVYERERVAVRRVEVSPAVEIDGTAAASTNDITATVDRQRRTKRSAGFFSM